jgi:glycosyltransferase involved in cell wall biosynthesis
MINNKNLPSFDLMHFTYYLPSRFIYHKTFKSVSTIHDFTPETLYSKFDLNRYMHYAKLSYIKHSSGLIFVSNHTRNLVSKIYPSIILPKNKVIHHGVSPQSNVKTSTVDNEVPFFFYVGNRNGYKNFNQLLLAFAKFSKKHLVFLLCFGGGQFTKEENVLISRLNLNSFVKHVGSDEKDLEKYFGSALAFINPSVEEGFGMTNLEALSCGTAVLCSDISIFREILSDKSYYFNPQNTESIYLQMLRIFQNPLSDHKKRELVNFSNKYNWITAARKTSSFYESLLNQKILN